MLTYATVKPGEPMLPSIGAPVTVSATNQPGTVAALDGPEVMVDGTWYLPNELHW